jgi:hypothetical protein
MSSTSVFLHQLYLQVPPGHWKSRSFNRVIIRLPIYTDGVHKPWHNHSFPCVINYRTKAHHRHIHSLGIAGRTISPRESSLVRESDSTCATDSSSLGYRTAAWDLDWQAPCTCCIPRPASVPILSRQHHLQQQLVIESISYQKLFHPIRIYVTSAFTALPIFLLVAEGENKALSLLTWIKQNS